MWVQKWLTIINGVFVDSDKIITWKQWSDLEVNKGQCTQRTFIPPPWRGNIQGFLIYRRSLVFGKLNSLAEWGQVRDGALCIGL